MVMRLTNPVEALLRLQRSLDASRGEDWFGTRTSSRAGFPLVNVFRKGHDFVMTAEIPGANKEDINVEVKGDELRLTGQRDIDYPDNVSLHRRERQHGQFDRTVTFPAEIDADNVKAEYKDGILAVSLPRAEADKPRTVIIN